MAILDIVTDADRPPGGPWLDSVTGWVRRCSGRDEVILVVVVTEAWSTVWCTAGGEERLWFKESPWANRAEGAVHAALARLAPAQVTAPVGWDSDRGWLLTRDGGQILADRDGLAGLVLAYFEDAGPIPW